MTPALAWVWAPLILFLICLGAGLLADRLLRARIPAALLAPAGLAVVIVVVTPVYKLGLSAVVATPLVLVLALAGFVLARSGLGSRIWDPWALGAGAVVYALYMAPVVLSGDAVWAGYNFVNDTASNFILIDLLREHGSSAQSGASAYDRVANYLTTSGYPIGSHAVQATVMPLTGVGTDAVYQPVLAVFGALTGIALTDIARRAGLRPAGAASAAVVAMGGVLIYRYSLHGAIKEQALTALCATSAALAMVAVKNRLATGTVILVAACCLGMVLVYSAAAGVYVAALAVVVLGAAFLSPDPPSWRHIGKLTAIGAGAALVVLLPMLGSTLDFAEIVTDVFTSSDRDRQDDLGHLLRPLPASEAAGIWLARDYRLAVESALTQLNTVLVAAAVAMAVAGTVLCAVKRRFGPLILLGIVALPAVALAPFVPPYIEGKLLVTLTPAIVLLAMIAALSLLGTRPLAGRIAGGLAVAVVAGGVLASDLYSYRETKLPPPDRIEALEDAGANVPGSGLWLFNEWEEFGKFFLHPANVNPASERDSSKPVKLRKPVLNTFGRFFDLDLQQLGYVDSFAGIITRRSPAASRPPSSFRRIYRNRYYELWQRDPDVRVIAHVPLQGLDRATALPSCRKVMALARGARDGDRLVGARAAPVASLSPLLAERPDSWRPTLPPGTVIPSGPGRFAGVVTVSQGGAGRVWLRMNGGRPYTVLVDGRRVGAAQQINTPDQWLEVGGTPLRAGRHRVEVTREGASFGPGDSFRGEVGPVALQTGAARLVAVRPAQARRLCGQSWDWVELVRGGPLPRA